MCVCVGGGVSQPFHVLKHEPRLFCLMSLQLLGAVSSLLDPGTLTGVWKKAGSLGKFASAGTVGIMLAHVPLVMVPRPDLTSMEAGRACLAT